MTGGGTATRREWRRGSQERAIERFYGPGTERFADYHGGMLNFGLWDDGADDYRTASRNLVHRVATSIGIGPESRLLDVACGMGAQDVFLADALGCRSIVGLDVTFPHVVVARQRAASAGLDARLRFEHGTAVDLPFHDRSFTHVICVEGGPHFDTREGFLREAFRVLAPGGGVALSDYVVKRRPRTRLERLLLGIGRHAWRVPKENVDTAEDLRRKMAEIGFADVRIEEAGAAVIPGYYREGRKPESMRAMAAIRGLVRARVSLLLDDLVYQLWARGVVEYVFVSARKP